MKTPTSTPAKQQNKTLFSGTNNLILTLLFFALTNYQPIFVNAQPLTGGPDAFGYKWIHSYHPSGPVFNWIDISNLPGTVIVSGLADDNKVGPFPLGIPFEFYGLPKNQFWICSNGFIVFINASIAQPFPSIPSPLLINDFIAGFGSDLTFTDVNNNPIPGASCMYWVSPGNDSLIVTFQDVPFWDNSTQGYTGLNSFQFILCSSDYSITFQYLDQVGVAPYISNFFTSGIENFNGITGLQVLFDAYPIPFTSVKFTMTDINRVRGKVFLDMNSNNTQDLGESNISFLKLIETNGGDISFSNTDGYYSFISPTNWNFNIVPSSNLIYFTPSPASYSVAMGAPPQIDSANHFAFQPAGVFNDLCTDIIPLTNFRSGMQATYKIKYRNQGTTTINNCSIVFYPDSSVSFVSSSVTPYSTFADSVIWNIGNLSPMQQGEIIVYVSVVTGLPIGTMINSGAKIEPVAGDDNPSCNLKFWELLTTGSFDPNDIIVDRWKIFTNQTSNPPELRYLIRFQNTGNDTAFTVKTINPLSPKLNANTFEMIDASHDVIVDYFSSTRHLKFTFNNILLPDSNVNEPASHGYIYYKIKPVTNLLLGNQIPNYASIYFDFNDSVLTNTAITTVVSPVGLTPGPSPKERGEVWVWPNPASDEITISLTNSKSSAPVIIRLYDLTGRTVMEEKIISSGKNSITLSIASLNKGMYMVEIEVNGEKQRGRFVKGD